MIQIRGDDVVIRRGETFPAEWLRRLREISPYSEVFSYLLPVWFRRTRYGGTAREEVLSGKGRWVLYQIKPRWCITPRELAMLDGPHPFDYDISPSFPDAWQYEWWHRSHRLELPVPFWVLQGDHGGHKAEFTPIEQKMLQGLGLPTDPPPVGELPACPFDERSAYQLLRFNRLRQLGGNLEALMRSGTIQSMEKEVERDMREFRKTYIKWLAEQMKEPADALNWAMSKSDVRDQWDPYEQHEQDVEDAIEAEDRFVELGSVTAA